jgi:hypothetical protein
MNDIYVVESHRQGAERIGYRLCQKSLEWFELQQVDHIEGWISTQNVGAREFFGRLGFEESRILIRKSR